MINLAETGPNPKDAPETDMAEAEIARLINQAGSDPGLNRPFMEPKGAQPKRGRGRPKKEAPSVDTSSTPPPEGEPGPTPDAALKELQIACRGIFTVASGSLVRYTNVPAVALNEQEIQALGDTWGSVVNRYLPQLAQTHIELVAALTVTAMCGFRIRGVLMEEIERKKAAGAKEFKQPVVVPGQ